MLRHDNVATFTQTMTLLSFLVVCWLRSAGVR